MGRDQVASGVSAPLRPDRRGRLPLPTEAALDAPVDGQEIGLDPHGEQLVAYREVSDVTKALAELVEAGATERQSPRDVGGGKLIATAADPDGNVIGLIQPVS